MISSVSMRMPASVSDSVQVFAPFVLDVSVVTDGTDKKAAGRHRSVAEPSGG